MLKGDNVEDSRVELKADWPTDTARAARQIAGLANASGGETVVWLIGVDEKAHELRAASPTELQNWWSAVSKRFSEVSPEMFSLVVPVPQGDSTVIALAFETSRSPYLVTTDGRSGVERDIPWREGNSTRSAKRSEILRTVVDQARVPQMELVKAYVTFDVDRTHPDGYAAEWTDPEGVTLRVGIHGSAVAFVECAGPAFLPEHRWSSHLTIGELTVDLATSAVGPRATVGTGPSGFHRYEPRGEIEYVPESGLSIRGSDAITISLRGYVDIALRERIEMADQATVECVFPIAMSERSASIAFDMASAPMIEIDDHGNGDRGFKMMTQDGNCRLRYY